jgi:hypothetical protein
VVVRGIGTRRARVGIYRTLPVNGNAQICHEQH